MQLPAETVHEVTQSICPHCRRLIDAEIFSRDHRVLMRKTCPEHGQIESLLFGDAELYTRIAPYNKPGTPPRECATGVQRGCPYDCGTCPEHKQHACVGLIEVNNACNLDCPLCCANAGTHHNHDGFELTIDQVDFILDRFVAAEGSPEVVQFSGGEPTLHPRIFDFIELAQRKGINYTMLNTNGIRIAHDDAFLEGLAKLKPHVYLQFDGFDPEVYRTLRGRTDLLDLKLRALDRMAETDVRVVLVAAIERGVNEHEVGRIVEFGLRHPAVFGVNFQPVFRVNRHVNHDPMARITIPDVLKALESQTHGLFTLDDFVPVPCCEPTCSFVTYALLDGDTVLPIPRVLEVDQYLDYIKNRTMPGLNDDLLRTLERLWSSSAIAGSEEVTMDVGRALGMDLTDPRSLRLGLSERDPAAPTRADARCPSCHSHLPLDAHKPRDLARHIFMVNTRDFMDPWTFNVKTLHKCCVSMLVPDGRAIPFCAYNSIGYREQVMHSLMQNRLVVASHDFASVGK